MPGSSILNILLKLAQTQVHSTISSSAILFFFCLQYSPASGSFQMSQAFCIRWPKYWSFSFSISPSNAYLGLTSFTMGFPGGSDGKASACDAGDLGLIPGSGRPPGEGNGNPLQFSCLENPMDRGAWWVPVHGVARVGHN